MSGFTLSVICAVEFPLLTGLRGIIGFRQDADYDPYILVFVDPTLEALRVALSDGVNSPILGSANDTPIQLPGFIHLVVSSGPGASGGAGGTEVWVRRLPDGTASQVITDSTVIDFTRANGPNTSCMAVGRKPNSNRFIGLIDSIIGWRRNLTATAIGLIFDDPYRLVR